MEEIVDSWPIHIRMDNVIKWILQFESQDYELAIRVLSKLQVLGPVEVREALNVAHTKLQRHMATKGSELRGNNTLYAGIGSSAKSGAMIAYQYRTTLELPDADFLSGEEEEELDFTDIENIVFLDDVIGTGQTIAKEVKRIAEEVYTLAKSRNIFVLTVAAYQNGMEHIVKETGATVVCALEYEDIDTAASLDSAFYDGLPIAERSRVLDTLKRYCRTVSKSDLGFGNLGGLLVFDHNTPNTSLPIVWARGKSWTPLFARSPRIPGAAKVLRTAEDARKKEEAGLPKHGQQSLSRTQITLTLFVEGKLDELFVDYLRSKHALASKLDLADINAIALGAYSSLPVCLNY